MRGLIWPIKIIALASLAAAGMLMVSGLKASEPQNAPFTIEAAQGHTNEGGSETGGAGGFRGAGY